MAGANLYAEMYGVQERATKEDVVTKILPGITVPEFIPKSGVKIGE